MPLFGNKKGHDINEGEASFRKMPGALLIDVREREEYAEGHLLGSINLPLGSIDRAGEIVASADTPVFVYCRSGARSSLAAGALLAAGYRKVFNIGGIIDYGGRLEREAAAACK